MDRVALGVGDLGRTTCCFGDEPVVLLQNQEMVLGLGSSEKCQILHTSSTTNLKKLKVACLDESPTV